MTINIPKPVLDQTADWALKVLLFVLGYLVHRLVTLWKLRGLLSVWKPFVSGEDAVAVVLSTRPGPHTRSTPRISLMEMLSFSELSQLCRKLRREIQPFASDIDIELLKARDLIIIGGPGANPVAQQIWRLIKDRVPIEFRSDDLNFVIEKTQYAPCYAADGSVTRDYGVVVRTKSPLLKGSGKHVMICFGAHGYGSHAALCSVMQRDLVRAIRKQAHGEDFAALVEVAVDGHTVLSSHLVACRVLGDI